jgi:DNA-binding GntR family transcriptional regulator
MSDQPARRRSGRRTLVDGVRDALLGDLFSNVYVAGDQLPNEAELAERFECSRATIREAVRGLVDGGYLLRRHGKGTFVTAPPRRRHTLNASLSYTDMIREAGLEPGRTLIRRQTRPATAEEAEQLALAPHASVLFVERIRTADGRPVVYSRDRIPAALLGAAADGVVDPSLYRLLESVGVDVRSALAMLRPVVADDRLARLLQVPVGAPLQQIEQVHVDETGQPVMLSSEWHVPDVFVLSVNRVHDAAASGARQ